MKHSFVKYDKSPEEWDLVVNNKERIRFGESWLRDNTIDSWRHKRMREFVDPIVKDDTKSTWVTIGDGRFGTDGHYLLTIGAEEVHCTDISDTLLRIGQEKGFIRTFSVENAEFLSFADNSFDYVYCKESIHHFPRPFIAISEMFRIARKGVFLIEPRDRLLDKAPMSFILDVLRKFKGVNTSCHDFEPVGNYIYTISERELEKFLLGIHYTKIAFNGVNDAYFPGAEFVELSSSSFSDRIKIFRLKAAIAFQNIQVYLKLKKTALLVSILFKAEPSAELAQSLRAGGWSIRNLPSNPYL
jgi:SAM-dependent methyltransferase